MHLSAFLTTAERVGALDTLEVATKVVEVAIMEEAVMDTEVALDRFHFKSTAPCLPCLLREVQLATEIPTTKKVEMVEIKVTAEPLSLLLKARIPVVPRALTIKAPTVLQVAQLEAPAIPKKEEPVHTAALLVHQAAQATAAAPVAPQALVDTQVVAQELQDILEEAVGLEDIRQVEVGPAETKDLEATLEEAVDPGVTLVETVDLEATLEEVVDRVDILVVPVDMEEATDL